jgi:hypothetical protein
MKGERAKPWWLLLAACLQGATYLAQSEIIIAFARGSRCPVDPVAKLVPDNPPDPTLCRDITDSRVALRSLCGFPASPLTFVVGRAYCGLSHGRQRRAR